jgi:hypothetical protein
MNMLKKKQNKIPVHNSLQKKIPGNRLNEKVKCVYNESYKTLMKEIKEETRSWKHLPCHGL